MLTEEKRQRAEAIKTLIRVGWSPPKPNSDQAARIIDDICRVSGDGRHATSVTLTERELLVLSLLADGHTREGVADRMHYSVDTIKTCVQGILRKLGAKNTAHAVAIAYRAGELELRRP